MVRTPNYDNADFEDDTNVLNKDIQVRRRYMKWFNKRRDDFDTDAAYDDYLEMVEGIIFNVVNNVDVEATKERVEKYRQQNQAEIGQNQAKRVEEWKIESERVVKLERKRAEMLNDIHLKERIEEEERKRKLRREHAEQLVRFSKGDDEYNKLVRKREKAERKKRKREAEVLRMEQQKAKMDEQAVLIRPTFPHPPPKVKNMSASMVTADLRPQTRDEQPSPKRLAAMAAAAGFNQNDVYNRAITEFQQALDYAFQMSQTVCQG